MSVPAKRFPELGKRLKKCRLITNLYRREVAEFLGVNEHTIYYWEKGQTRPNTDNLNQLSRLYSVSVDYLVGRSEDPQHYVEGKQVQLVKSSSK